MADHLIIANPAAGRGLGAKRIRRARSLLEASGLDFELHVTAGPGEARALARAEAYRRRTAVVLGGDGSIQEVAGGLAEARLHASDAEPGDIARFGILPAGTGNDFIKAVGLPGNLDEAFAILRTGRVRPLDLGRISWRLEGEDAPAERLFANNVGLGFEGQVGWEADGLRLPLRGTLLYLLALLRVLPALVNPPLAIRFDDGTELAGPKLLLSAGNGSSSGGGFRLNPGADPFDGLLDVCVVDALKRSRILRLLPRAMKGTHTGLAGVTCRRDTGLEIHSERPCHAHADGELLARSIVWARIRILPGLLPLICGPTENPSRM